MALVVVVHASYIREKKIKIRYPYEKSNFRGKKSLFHVRGALDSLAAQDESDI